VLFLVTTAHAASFDCGKATSEVEKLICGDDELSKLDDSLNKAYLQALKRPDMEKQTIKSQRLWVMQVRNACKDAECLKIAYQIRLNELGLLSPHRTKILTPPDPRISSSKAPAKASKSEIAKPPVEVNQTKTEQQNESTIGPDEELPRSLTMTCDYSDYGKSQRESVSITHTMYDQGGPAGIKQFERGKNREEHETFTVNSGECAECIYPSGNRVRVKVGEGSSSAYGECGGDPLVFMSLWVNGRKIVSRLDFAGHCSEILMRGSPTMSFKIYNLGNHVSLVHQE